MEVEAAAWFEHVASLAIDMSWGQDAAHVHVLHRGSGPVTGM